MIGIFIGIAGSTGCTAPAAARLAKPAWDFGPIAAGYAGVDGTKHATALGPFYEHAVATNGETALAVRPFYGAVKSSNETRRTYDIVWPIAQRRYFADQSESRFLIFMSYHHELSNTNNGRHRLWLLPFWYSGIDVHGSNYWALFPVYGSIHEFIGRDTIDFTLWPIRSTSTLNDLHTSNWMWPFYSKTTTTDDHIYRHRLFPFFAYSHTRGSFTKRSVMWPLWTSVKYEYPGEHGGGWILWPVCGRMNTDMEKTLWIVPPFFRFTTGKKLDRYYCPWPFVQIERGIDENKTYIWPFWGRKHVGTVDSTFYLWPFIWNDYMERGWYRDHLFMIAPIYRHYVTIMKGEKGAPSFTTEHQEKIWPVFNYRHKDGASQFHLLDLWPLAENSHADLNWAPFWTVYGRTWLGKDLDSRLLGGMYRHQRRGDEANYVSVFPLFTWRRDDEEKHFHGWSILKGLLAHERNDSGARWRLLYFLHFGHLKEEQP